MTHLIDPQMHSLAMAQAIEQITSHPVGSPARIAATHAAEAIMESLTSNEDRPVAETIARKVAETESPARWVTITAQAGRGKSRAALAQLAQLATGQSALLITDTPIDLVLQKIQELGATRASIQPGDRGSVGRIVMATNRAVSVFAGWGLPMGLAGYDLVIVDLDRTDGRPPAETTAYLASLSKPSAPWIITRAANRHGALPADEFVDVVFNGPPGPTGGVFIETERPDGTGCGIGEWIVRGNGYHALRIPVVPGAIR